MVYISCMDTRSLLMNRTILTFMTALLRTFTKVNLTCSVACIKNDGLYVKFGQGIASMDHLLPPPFYKHMSKLQDKARSVDFDKVSKLF